MLISSPEKLVYYSGGHQAGQPRWRGYLAAAARVEYSAAPLHCKFNAPSACCERVDLTNRH